MNKFKEFCKFAAGFQLAHVIAHIMLHSEAHFPVTTNFGLFKITLSKSLNMSAIWTNVIIFLLFFYFAYCFKRAQKY